MKHVFLTLVTALLLMPALARAQDRASLSGFVTDATSGETLLLAHVAIAGTPIGTVTNNAGYYVLSGLQAGTHTLVVTYVGFREKRQEIILSAGESRRLDVELVPATIEGEEVTVTAERIEEDDLKRIGVAQLRTRTVTQVPAVLEPDVFRTLQLLPGVKAASDYSSGLYIRGGSPDQTLILLDRTTVYNPTHFFGFFSTFNPDAIKDVRLYKGGYPAQYGGRLGAVVDIYNKDGNRRQTGGSASVGLLASRVMVEGPYSHGSWMLAVRRSTLEPVLAVLRSADIESIPDRFYFYDVNGKVNLDLSSDDRLSLAFYAGTDKLDISILGDAEVNLAYGNTTASANWTHLFSQTLFSNFTFTASRYASVPSFDLSGTTFSQDNSVSDLSAKGDFEYIPSERHALSAGFWTGLFTFQLRNLFDGQETLDAKIGSFYTSLYLQDTFRPSPLWSLQAGVRASYFGAGDYVRLEPRLSLEHRPFRRIRLQAGYGRYYQFLTLITSELFSGFDTWLTTGAGVPPSFGDQYVAGVKGALGGDLNVDVEVYYRTMRDLFELDPFLMDVAGMEYDQLFRFGDGHAYGTEVMLEKTRGRLNGFIAYTLGRTRRRFPEVNEFRYYSPKYDRTHDMNAVINYDLTRAWRVSGVFTYGTGQVYTDPAGRFTMIDDPFSSAPREVLVARYNNARLPPYHRLDLGVSNRGRFFGFADYELQVQVINAYNRRNIWFYLFEFPENKPVDRTEVPQIPVPIPNLSLTLKF